MFISFRVSIKTLKNSANAVLPEWYSITPLLKNHDEVYAFTGLHKMQLYYIDIFNNELSTVHVHT